MIWLILEALADPSRWAISIKPNGDIHLEEAETLTQAGVKVRGLSSSG